jgi:hypothetical protein
MDFRHLTVFVLLVGFTVWGGAANSSSPSEKEGTLVVKITYGDIDNTPADNVYVEAYGYVASYGSKKSFVLKNSSPGRYEATLPAGVYDVFVSDGVSFPRCRRALITEKSTGYWTLKLETDDVYLQR